MLNLSFTINSQHQSANYPLAIISKQRYQWLRYAQTVPGHGVAIAFMGLPELTEKNIFLFNEGGCSANQDDYLGYTVGPIATVVNNLTYKFETRILDFYLTDITNDLPRSGLKPLWFYHTLLNNDGSAVESYINLHILDKDMVDVDPSDWQVVQENDPTDLTSTKKVWKIYHDLEPSLIAGTDLYKAYYVTYQSNAGEKIFNLLDSRRVFLRLDDINADLDYSQRTYKINATSSGIYEVVTEFLGVVNKPLYFRPALTGQIKAFKPFEVNNELSWRLKFTNGGFITSIRLPNGTYRAYRYAIPEFKKQAFYQNRIREKIREMPVVNGSNEGTIISKQLIQTKYAPLYLNSAHGCYLEIVVLDKDGIGYDGYTNNPYKNFWQNPGGTNTVELRDFTRFNDFSYNTESGIIRIPYELKDGDRVLINGYYIENFFEYEYEFNPVFNREVLDRKVLFYLRPQVIIDRLLIMDDPWADRGLYHIITDDKDRIVDYARDIDGTPADPDLKDNNTWELNQWIEKYPEKLIISKVYIGRLASTNDIEVIDTRLRGGGIRDEYDPAYLANKAPEVSWIADFGHWDGRPYPGQASLLVEIPKALTVAGGGDLEEDDVRTIVEKHMALGVYPIIQYYGSRPTIQAAWAEKAGEIVTINLEWDSVETAQSYHVYSIGLDGTRTKIGDTENTFIYDVVIPLVASNTYTFQIYPVHDGEEGLPSDKVSVKAG